MKRRSVQTFSDAQLDWISDMSTQPLGAAQTVQWLALWADRGWLRRLDAALAAQLGLSPTALRVALSRSLDELAEHFDVVNVNPNPARFDQKKADAINAAHIRLLGAEDFKARLLPYLQSAGVLGSSVSADEDAILTAAAPLIQERLTVLSEAPGLLSFLFTENVTIEDDAKAGLPENAAEIVRASIEALDGVEWNTEAIQNALNKKLIEELELKPRNAFGPLRTAISGRRVSPPLFESMEILGREVSLARLEAFARNA